MLCRTEYRIIATEYACTVNSASSPRQPQLYTAKRNKLSAPLSQSPPRNDKLKSRKTVIPGRPLLPCEILARSPLMRRKRASLSPNCHPIKLTQPRKSAFFSVPQRLNVTRIIDLDLHPFRFIDLARSPRQIYETNGYPGRGIYTNCHPTGNRAHAPASRSGSLHRILSGGSMPIKWTKDVDAALAEARQAGKPLLLDFNAAPM